MQGIDNLQRKSQPAIRDVFWSALRTTITAAPLYKYLIRFDGLLCPETKVFVVIPVSVSTAVIGSRQRSTEMTIKCPQCK